MTSDNVYIPHQNGGESGFDYNIVNSARQAGFNILEIICIFHAQ